MDRQSPPTKTRAGRSRVLSPGRRRTAEKSAHRSGTDYELQFWAAADKLRGVVELSEYKSIVLGLIFLRFLSEASESRETRGTYSIPAESRWSNLQAHSPQPIIGEVIDRAMAAVERENPSLQGIFPAGYGKSPLASASLGELVNLISAIGLGQPAGGSKELLCQVFESFLGKFAISEGRYGGERYTPQSVARLLVEMIEPIRGRIYDPCCGSGGLFVSSERFVLARGGRKEDLALYGQEAHLAAWRLARMNLAIQDIDADLGSRPADSFLDDLHRDLKADYVLANPPFKTSLDSGSLRDNERWAFGIPPAASASFAWIQHCIFHLAPRGITGLVLPNGPLFSQRPGEWEIRKNLVEADLADCIVALPGQLFSSTGIPVCLWLIARDKKTDQFRDRGGETLFIDAREMGVMISRSQRILEDREIARIARTYHLWRGENPATPEPGFFRSVSLEEIRLNRYNLMPSRYVEARAAEAGEPFEVTMTRLTALLRQQAAKATTLDEKLWHSLERLGYGAANES